MPPAGRGKSWPSTSMGAWDTWAATAFLSGLLLVGVGFLLFYLDSGRAIIQRYGGLGKALGWPQLFGRNDGNAPPPAVVASTMVTIVNTLGITTGAAILVMSLINLHVPAFEVDPLLAKNLTYFFGHVFINATIYMAVIAVYYLLPRFTGRAWPARNKAFLAAAGIVLAAGLWILFETTLGFRALTQETARRLELRENPRPVPAYCLQLQDGSKATLADLRGRLVVATFMSTRCRSLCPMVGARMAEIRSRLRLAVDRDQVHFLSVSFDPKVDTPDHLAGDAANFCASLDNWWVARPCDDLDDMLRFFGATVIPAGQGMYVHNAAFYVLDRQQRLVLIIDANDPEAVGAAMEEAL